MISDRLLHSLLLISLAIALTGMPVRRACAVTDTPSADSLSGEDANRTNLMLLPILFSTPDTRLAGGLLPQLVYRAEGSKNPSSIRLDAYYTLNRQYHMLLRPSLWLQEDLWYLEGRMSHKKWPTTFYGIGNSTPEEAAEGFTEYLYEFNWEASRSFRPGLYAGVSYALRYAKVEPDLSGSRLASGGITGNGTTLTSGPGLALMLDTRDNHFFPSRGRYHRFTLQTAQKMFGSDLNFTRLKLDLRRYLPIAVNRVLALQGAVESTFGEIPFRMLPSVGSGLRGYASTRHIDANSLLLQAEYRMVPLAWRFGVTAFAGVSQVFRHPDEIRFSRFHYAVGVGLRFLFSRSEKVNIRYDYAVGRSSTGDYFELNEAF